MTDTPCDLCLIERSRDRREALAAGSMRWAVRVLIGCVVFYCVAPLVQDTVHSVCGGTVTVGSLAYVLYRISTEGRFVAFLLAVVLVVALLAVSLFGAPGRPPAPTTLRAPRVRPGGSVPLRGVQFEQASGRRCARHIAA